MLFRSKYRRPSGERVMGPVIPSGRGEGRYVVVGLCVGCATGAGISKGSCRKVPRVEDSGASSRSGLGLCWDVESSSDIVDRASDCKLRGRTFMRIAEVKTKML